MKIKIAFQKEIARLTLIVMIVAGNLVSNLFWTPGLINTSLLGISLFLLVAHLKKMNIKL